MGSLGEKGAEAAMLPVAGEAELEALEPGGGVGCVGGDVREVDGEGTELGGPSEGFDSVHSGL